MTAWAARHLALIDFAVASLARRRGKTLSLWAVYTLVVFLLASVMLFGQAIRDEAARTLDHTPDIVVQKLMAGRHDLVSAAALDAIRAIRGVQAAEGRRWGYLFDPVAAANYTVMVAPADWGLGLGQARIGDGVAAVRGAARGDLLSFRGHDGQVVGLRVADVLDRDSALVSADLVLVGADDFRRLFGMPDTLFTDIAVTVRNPREVRKVAEKIDAALPGGRVILREEMRRTYQSLFDWREGVMLVLLAGSALAFVIFAWDKASGLSAEERREIGILKAVGWETADILRLKGLEGTLVSLAAFLGGYVAAYVHVFYFQAGILAPVLKGWSVLYPDFRLTPRVDELQLATLFFFTVLPYGLATVVPVWRAATIDPDEVMR